MFEKLKHFIKRLITEEDGYWGKYPGNDADARRDKKLWETYLEQFDLLDEAYQMDISASMKKQGFFLDNMSRNFVGLGNQYGAEAFKLGANKRKNANEYITNLDEMEEQYYGSQIRNQYLAGGQGLVAERTEGLFDREQERKKLGMELDLAYNRAMVEFQQSRTNPKYDPSKGYGHSMTEDDYDLTLWDARNDEDRL